MTGLVYAVADYLPLAADLCRLGGLEAGHLERKTFPDGERYLRVCDELDGRDVVLVAGTVSDQATLELYDLAFAIVTQGARRLTMVVPWYGYATMERAGHPGDVVTAKTRAHLLSSLPLASTGNRILLLDLHSEGIPHYFDGRICAVHVYGSAFVSAAARRLFPDGFVLAATDAGRAKWVESLANHLGVNASFVFKRRLSGSETEVTAVSAQVEGHDVIVYDDMVRTGSSLIGAARAYKAAGARHLAVITTHGVFPDGALPRLEASGLFEAIVCTDSHPNARRLASDFLTVESCAPLFLPHLQEHQ